jgi:hypothetical protein
MRIALAALSMLALLLPLGCKREGADSTEELREARAEVDNLKTKVKTLEDQDDKYRLQNIELSKKVNDLESRKEIGEVKVYNLKWDENDRESQLILTGTVENTGHAYLTDVTVKVAIKDETRNVIKAELVNKDDRATMPMLYYHNVTDALAKGDKMDFKLIIYTRNIHANSFTDVQEAIRKPQGDETWTVTPLFRTGG